MQTINIKGKEYIPVSERIKEFNRLYENGSITTEILSSLGDSRVVIKAIVIPDVSVEMVRTFTGYSQAAWGEGMVNQSSALENAETSAVGRALGMMGIGVVDSVASADEMHKSDASQNRQSRPNGYTKTASRPTDSSAGPLRKANKESVDYSKTSTTKWMSDEEVGIVEDYILAGKLNAVLTLVGKRRIKNSTLEDLEAKYLAKQGQAGLSTPEAEDIFGPEDPSTVVDPNSLSF